MRAASVSSNELLTLLGESAPAQAPLVLEGVPVVRILRAPPLTQYLDELRMALGERNVYAVGTVRSWADGDYIKTRDGWVKTVMPQKAAGVDDKVVLGPGDVISHEDYTKNMQSTVTQLQGLLDKGTLPGTLEDQIDAAKSVVAKHKKRFPKFMQSLQDAAPEGAEVSGRVKTFQSALGKLIVKPKYKTAEGLQDTTGTRIVCNSTDDVKSTVENLKKKYKVISEDDYISKPLGSMKYRSHHLIVEDEDGTAKEIQVRTKNQDAFGHWAHESYKPTTDAKREAIEKHSDEITKYAADMSDWLAAQDEGREPGERPAAPQVVKDVFGEIGAHPH